MTEIDFKTLIHGIRNDLKITIDDLFNAIEEIQEDVEKLKSEKSAKNKIN